MKNMTDDIVLHLDDGITIRIKYSSGTCLTDIVASYLSGRQIIREGDTYYPFSALKKIQIERGVQ